MTTPKYKFAIFGSTGNVEYNPTQEATRWTVLDTTLGTLMTMLGSGVLSGLEPVSPTSTSPVIKFNTGSVIINGLVGKVADTDVLVTEGVDLSAYIPESGTLDLYVVVITTNTTPQTGAITVTVNTEVESTDVVLVKVTLDSNGVLLTNALTGNTTQHYNDAVYTRPTVGLDASIASMLAAHVHTGVNGNPSKVDLGSHVTGKLPAANIQGPIPASKISGTITVNNIVLSHTKLLDIGHTPHAQLDEFYKYLIDTLQSKAFERYGLVNVINRLKHTITLLQTYPGTGTDKCWRLVNEHTIVPGVTPASWIDLAYTTATVDTDNHVITGVKGTAIAEADQQLVTSYWDQRYDTPVGRDGSLHEDYGFAGSTAQPFPDTTNIEILGVDTHAYVTLAALSRTNQYLPNGTFYVRVDVSNAVKWTSISWTVTNGTGVDSTSSAFAVQAKATNSDTYNPDNLDGWVDVSGDLSGLEASRHLWIKCLFTASSDRTASPTLSQLSVVYDPSSPERAGFWVYNDKTQVDSDTYTKDRDVVVLDTECPLFDMTLESHPVYLPSATIISPIIDTGDVYVWWDRLYTSYVIPDRVDLPILERPYIKVYGRFTDASGLAASTGDGWNNSWASTTDWEELVFDEYTDISAYYSGGVATTTGHHEQYAQFKYELYSASDRRDTPEIVGISLLYYTEGELGGIHTRTLHYARSGADIDCWGAPGAVLSNVNQTTVSGAITLTDTNNTGVWVSPTLNSGDAGFIQWSALELVGEELHKCRLRLQFSKDGNIWRDELIPDTNTLYWYRPVSSVAPFLLDLDNVPSADGSNYAGGQTLTSHIDYAGVLTNTNMLLGEGDVIYRNAKGGSTNVDWEESLHIGTAKILASYGLNKAIAFGCATGVNPVTVYISETTGNIPAGMSWDNTAILPSSGGYTMTAGNFGSALVGCIVGRHITSDIWTTADGGYTWVKDTFTKPASYDYLNLLTVSASSATNIWTGGYYQLSGTKHWVLYHKGAGGTWESIPAPTVSAVTWDLPIYSVLAIDTNTVLVCGKNGMLLKGVYSSSWTWSTVNNCTAINTNTVWRSLQLDKIAGGKVWVSGNGASGPIAKHTPVSAIASGAWTDKSTGLNILAHVSDVSGQDTIAPDSYMTWIGDFGVIGGYPTSPTGHGNAYAYTEDGGVSWALHYVATTSQTPGQLWSATYVCSEPSTDVVEPNKVYPYMRVIMELEG